MPLLISDLYHAVTTLLSQHLDERAMFISAPTMEPLMRQFVKPVSLCKPKSDKQTDPFEGLGEKKISVE